MTGLEVMTPMFVVTGLGVGTHLIEEVLKKYNRDELTHYIQIIGNTGIVVYVLYVWRNYVREVARMFDIHIGI